MQWHTQEDFHTVIPPKFWPQKKKYTFIYSDIYIAGYVSSF